jgi:hypothetical protein
MLAIALLFSCDNDDEAFKKPETEMFFHGTLNAKEKTLIENMNGFRFKTEDTCLTLSNGVAFNTASSLFQGNSNYHMSNREIFGLNFYNLFDTTLINSTQIITNYFTSPMPFYYIDTLTGTTDEYRYGVEILWNDGQGNIYTSLNTKQNGSFRFENFVMELGDFGRSIKFEGSFSCLLYCRDEQKLIFMNDATTRFNVITSCY